MTAGIPILAECYNCLKTGLVGCVLRRNSSCCLAGQARYDAGQVRPMSLVVTVISSCFGGAYI
jgi:hypothetical protein